MNTEDVPQGGVLDTDVCIVGAGAAGITAAAEFANTQCRVLVLESGGLKFDHRTQLLYRSINTGREYPSLEFTKRRQFGGSTTAWFGRCRPLDAIDFESRTWVSHSGWPISRLDLDPYYSRAVPYCQLVSDDYEVKNDPFASSIIETKRFHFSPPTDFGNVFRKELEQAANIELLLNTNVTRIGLDPDGTRVDLVDCKTLSGRTFRVRAKVFVLAASALENTRLLLASRDVHPNGIGNQNDLVGRYFMEHPHFFTAVIESLPEGFPQGYARLNYELEQTNLVTVNALGVRQDVMRREQMLNAGAFLVYRPEYKTTDTYYSEATTRFIKIMEVLEHRAAPTMNLFRNMLYTMSHPSSVFRLMKSAYKGRSKQHGKYTLRVQLETEPNPESRVFLSDKRNALGEFKTVLNWKTTRLDVESYQRFNQILQSGLQKSGLTLRPIRHDHSEDGWPVSLHPGKHHMGTTRMHKSEGLGVVDEHCRVHGVPNLYVTSGSVFPTSGMANPTLTIVALAIRVVDHIKRSDLFSA